MSDHLVVSTHGAMGTRSTRTTCRRRRRTLHEHGYDATTVAQIAQRAGVTKSTFFRYFPDKRDVLEAGQETLSQLLAEGIAKAP